MSTKPAPQRLSIVSASTEATINRPGSIPSEAMSTPRTPWSPEAPSFVPARPATHSNSRVFVSQEYQAAQEQRQQERQQIYEAQAQWRQHDNAVKSETYGRHPGLHYIFPKLTRLPYHWSALCQLEQAGCFCHDTRRSAPCLQHDWFNRWAWLAAGGPWESSKNGHKQEYTPRSPEVLQRPLDPVVFHRWLTGLPCSCEAWKPAWDLHIERQWQKVFTECNLANQDRRDVARYRQLWVWASQYPEEKRLDKLGMNDALIWLQGLRPELFHGPTLFKRPTEFQTWMKMNYCTCREWHTEWRRLFQMVEEEDSPIIPRTTKDEADMKSEQQRAYDAAKETRNKNKLAKEVRRQKGQQVDITPAFNKHIFDLSKEDHSFIADVGNSCIVCRSRFTKKSPVLCRSTTWCPGKDESGTELESYREEPGDRLLASEWPNHTELDFEGTLRCSTEGGKFGRAFPLVGKCDMTGKRRPTVPRPITPSREQKPPDHTAPENYQNRPWSLPLDLDRSSWPLTEYVWQGGTFTISSFNPNDMCLSCLEQHDPRYVFYSGGNRCQTCSKFKLPHEEASKDDEALDWPSLEAGLWVAMNDPDIVELDDGGFADDTACQIWKALGI